MHIQCQNGTICITNKEKRISVINGVTYPWVDGMKGNSITQVNGKVYIDGYELKNGKWNKTLLGWYYKIF